jgi:SAM-dependent methyltransferase
MLPTDRERHHWQVAQGFPADKELVYPQHAQAHEFDLHCGAHVLEYGCGGGADTISWMKRGNRVTFVDIVAGNVDLTRARTTAFTVGGGNPSRGVALEHSDQVPDGPYDVVSSTGVLHHIRDPLPVVKEFRRVVAPNGVLYAMLYTEVLWERSLATIRGLVSVHRFSEEEAFCYVTDYPGPYARAYTAEEGTSLLADGGFDVVSTYDWNDAMFRTFKAVPR